MDPRDRLILALDVPTRGGRRGDDRTPGAKAVTFYKIGYQLGVRGRRAGDFARIARPERASASSSISSCTTSATRSREGVENVARMGVNFLTVHAYPQTMHAAVEARGDSLRILAVTVLTSYDDADLAAAGYDFTVSELAAERAAQARDIGVDGLICSAAEAARLRTIVGPERLLVTPRASARPAPVRATRNGS